MPQLSIQPSINDARGQALLQIVERLATIDLTPLLVYRLDSTPDSALQMLAWQFDILAPQWQLAAQTAESIDILADVDSLTDIDTLSSTASSAGASDYDSWRSLLKNAIPLHRIRGTPAAIKTALSSLGWTSVALLEGQSSWGGTQYPASQGWAVFRVVIDLPTGQPVRSDDSARIRSAVNFFKPVRALLDSIWFNLPALADIAPSATDFVVSIFHQNTFAASPRDAASAPAWPIADTKLTLPLYNRHFFHTGFNYGGGRPPVVDSGTVVLGQPIAPHPA
jgi:P2-related tail formation protein